MTDNPSSATSQAPVPAELAERVITVVAEARGLDRDAVGLDDTLEELGFDSLDGLDLFFQIEERFEVRIPDEVARQIVSVRDIALRLAAQDGASPASEEAP